MGFFPHTLTTPLQLLLPKNVKIRDPCAAYSLKVHLHLLSRYKPVQHLTKQASHTLIQLYSTVNKSFSEIMP